MAGSVNDKLLKAGAGSTTTLEAPGKAIGATTITVGSASGFPSDTGFVIAIRVVDTDGNMVAGKYAEYAAVYSGSGTVVTIDGTPIYGTDQIFPAGSTTQVFMPVSSAGHNRLIDAILEEHNQDGTHAEITATSVVTTANVEVGGDLEIATKTVSTGGGVLTIPADITTTVTGNSAAITPSFDTSVTCIVDIDQAITINAPTGTGTPRNGQGLMLRLKDNGTGRALTWHADYVFIGCSKPTTTVAGKLMYISMRYNATASQWDAIGVSKEA